MKQSLMIDKLKKAKDSLEQYKNNNVGSDELLDDAYNLIVQAIEEYDEILVQYYKSY